MGSIRFGEAEDAPIDPAESERDQRCIGEEERQNKGRPVPDRDDERGCRERSDCGEHETSPEVLDGDVAVRREVEAQVQQTAGDRSECDEHPQHVGAGHGSTVIVPRMNWWMPQ